MENVTSETKAQLAIKMVILDAIEKGHTNPLELAKYMESLVFENAVKNYIALMNEEA